jgi:hypothetical protein
MKGIMNSTQETKKISQDSSFLQKYLTNIYNTELSEDDGGAIYNELSHIIREENEEFSNF